MRWYLFVLTRSFQWSGRASREEFWMFTLVNFLISLVLSMLRHELFLLGGLISGLYALAMLPANFSVSSRRLHDTNRSAWWLSTPAIGVLFFIPLVNEVFVPMGTALVAGANGMRPVNSALTANLPLGPAVTLAILGGLLCVAFYLVLLVFYILKGDDGYNNYGPPAPIAPY